MDKKFCGYFISALCTISSIVTLISFVFTWTDPTCCQIIGYIVVVCLASWTYATWQTDRPSQKTFRLSNTLSVKVAPGDIFDTKAAGSFVVIPVNEYFDTIVDKKIVSASSIHGQFINKFYKDNHEQLHSQIDLYFKDHNIEGMEKDRPKSQGHTVQYPLGTCAVINKDGINYVLMALSHFDEDDHAYVELSEFGRAISSLCRTLANIADTHPIYMPLMGMGLSRLNQPAQFILKYTLDTIAAIKGLAINGGLNIVVYEPVTRTLNLNEISY